MTERFFPFANALLDSPYPMTDERISEMKQKKYLIAGVYLLTGFVILTAMLRYVDVRCVGPNGAKIGFAALNVWFHDLTGVHMALYTITDWLGLIPIFVCLCFGVVGMVQWLRRRSIVRVDIDIILLGVYYVLIILGYLAFEAIAINYRPILIDGALEASYPSSTTLLVLGVMPTLELQARRRVKSSLVRKSLTVFTSLFTSFAVLGRLVSGVHWLTDIVGAVLLADGLFMLYAHAVQEEENGRGVS